MEDHTTTDSTLEILSRLRADFPTTGAVLQAYLRRTEGDCRELAGAGFAGAAVQGRLRGAGDGRLPVRAGRRQVVRAVPEHPDVGRGLPDAGHPRPAAGRDRRGPGQVVRPHARTRSSSRCSTASARRSSPGWPSAGYTVRVYVPYGDEWYGYLMRRLAERPANVAFFARALTSRG